LWQPLHVARLGPSMRSSNSAWPRATARRASSEDAVHASNSVNTRRVARRRWVPRRAPRGGWVRPSTVARRRSGRSAVAGRTVMSLVCEPRAVRNVAQLCAPVRNCVLYCGAFIAAGHPWADASWSSRLRRISYAAVGSLAPRLQLRSVRSKHHAASYGKLFHTSTRLATCVYDPDMRSRGRAPRPLILIVDDVADTREMYESYLRLAGYGVDTARDGRQAVRLAQVARPDLIVMDLHMPGMDGWAAMRQLKSDPKTTRIPVIVLTGHDLKAYLKRSAIAEGAAAYLTKPVSPEQLARAIAVRLAQRGMLGSPAV